MKLLKWLEARQKERRISNAACVYFIEDKNKIAVVIIEIRL